MFPATQLQPRCLAIQLQDQLHLLLSTLARGEEVLTEGFQDFHRFVIITNTYIPGLGITATQEPTLADAAASLAWQPQWVRRFIELRATEDPAHPRKRRTLPFDKALKILQAEFPGNFNMDENELEFAWRSVISPRLGTGFRTMLKASAGELAVLSGGQQGPAQPDYGGQQGAHQGFGRGSQRPYQDVHALSYNAGPPQQDPNAPYGAPQPGYGGTQQSSGHGSRRMDPPPGPGPSSWGPQSGQGGGYYGAAQSGPGGQYPNAPGMGQIPASDSTNVRLPPIATFDETSMNQGYQSIQNQDYYNLDPQAGPSGSQEQMTFYRTGASSRRGAQRGGEVAISAPARYDQGFDFTEDEIKWLIDHGQWADYPDHGGWPGLQQSFENRFRGKYPTQRQLQDGYYNSRTL